MLTVTTKLFIVFTIKQSVPVINVMWGLKAKHESVIYLFILKVIINTNIRKCYVQGEKKGKRKRDL